MSSGRKGRMRIVHQRCCALDVHKKSITACVLVWDGKQLIEERKKEFGTTKNATGPAALLADGLQSDGGSHGIGGSVLEAGVARDHGLDGHCRARAGHE